MNERPVDLLPELLLLAGALGGLLVGLFVPRRRQGIVAIVGVLALLGALVAAIIAWAGPDRLAFDGSYRVDAITSAVRVIVVVALLLVLGLSREHVRNHPRESEFYVLLLLGGIGAIMLAGANDLLLLMAAYLLASVPLYALVGFTKTPLATEAALKYYLMGALLGITMLAGITVLYGLAGQSSYPQLAAGLAGAARGPLAVGLVAVLAGLFFKTGAVPAQFWVPDVADGTSAPAAAYVTTIPKIGGIAALFRLMDGPLQLVDVDWRLLLAIIAAASMTLGNFAAFFQDAPRRLLGYSTISQVGYLLLPVVVAGQSSQARPALLFYLAGYAVTNIGAFAVAAEFPRAGTLDSYAGLSRRRPGLAAALLLCLLGLVGTPPLAVFVGKLTVFSAAVDGGWAWLVVVAAANTVASLFYYLRWLAPVFDLGVRARSGTAGAADPLAPLGGWTAWTAYVAAGLSVVLGVASGLALTS